MIVEYFSILFAVFCVSLCIVSIAYLFSHSVVGLLSFGKRKFAERRAGQKSNTPVVSESAKTLLKSDPVTKQFVADPRKVHAFVRIAKNRSRCASCKIDFSVDKNAINHFKKHTVLTDPQMKAASVTQLRSSRHKISATVYLQLKALERLEQESLVAPLNSNSYKRQYDDQYIHRHNPSLLPAFVSVVRRIEGQKPPVPQKGFEQLWKSGQLLTKVYPAEYDNHNQKFPDVPTAFLSIFEQLADYKYRPCMRDKTVKAPGTFATKRWIYDDTNLLWNSEPRDPKATAIKVKAIYGTWGPTVWEGKSKKWKPATRSMQKNSTTLASSTQFDVFLNSYLTGIAFDANKCIIDDQYTWNTNKVTNDKWWLGDYSPDKSQNPVSYFGVQLQNLFYSVADVTAPQNEILARPTLESVVAITATNCQCPISRVSAYVQANYVDCYRRHKNMDATTVEVWLKEKHGNTAFTPYTEQACAQDLFDLMCSDQSLDPNNKFRSYRHKEFVALLLSKLPHLAIPTHILNLIKDKVKNSSLSQEYANSLSSEYSVALLASELGYKNQGAAKLVEVQDNKIIDGVKETAKDIAEKKMQGAQFNQATYSTISVIRNKLMQFDGYKGYTFEDIRNMCVIFSGDHDILKRMMFSMTHHKLIDLCQKNEDPHIFGLLMEVQPAFLDKTVNGTPDLSARKILYGKIGAMGLKGLSEQDSNLIKKRASWFGGLGM